MDSFHPRRGLTNLMRHSTRVSFAPFKNWQIRWFIRKYEVDLADALEPDPFSHTTFNAFFTRALRDGTRPLPHERTAICSPADGMVSECGPIVENTLLQAKGHRYRVDQLLAGDTAAAQRLTDGQFVTIYLSPRDYHRVHCPLDGTLMQMAYVPGKLYSVRPRTVTRVPGLFARNERVIFYFEGPRGPFVLVMVGALCVSSVETRWHGPVRAKGAEPTRWQEGLGREFNRGDELAHFNMGSTVILLFPADTYELDPLAPGSALRVGQKIGRFNA